MKKIILPIVAAVSSMALHVHAQVGVNTDKPASTFDITAKNATGTTKNVDGLLIPRVDRERAQNMSSVPTSTLIYINSAATGSQTGTAINIDAAGYYYYNGTAWTKLTSTGSNNIYNTDGTLTGNRIVTQGANTLAFNGTVVNAFSVDGTTLSVDAANNRVGIGTTTPNAPLQLVNGLGNRKIILHEGGNNDNEFYGFGINDYTLRYQSGANHVFYAGTGPTSSTELFRVNGDGNVAVGTSTPQKKFHVNGTAQFTNEINVGGTASTAGSPGTAGQILTSGGAGAAPTWTTPAVVTSTNIYNADGTLTANRTVTQGANTLAFTGGGNVGLGVANPAQKLSVVGGNDATPTSGIASFLPSNTTQGVGIGWSGIQKIGSMTNADLTVDAKGTGNISMQTATGVTGNVGIGTTTPSAKLHVNGTAQFNNEIKVGGAGNAGTAGQILTSAGAGAAPTWTTPTVPTSTNIYNADGTLTGNRAVAQGANTLAFTGTGNMGLGTATPQKRLHVDGDLQITKELNVGGSGTAAGSAGTAGQILTSAGAGAAPTWTTPAVPTSTNIYNADGTLTGNRNVNQGTNTLAFTGTGNVGIGTTTPSAKLHVNGTAQFNNEIKVGGAGNAGTAGQILTSAGAGAAPTWATPAVVTSTNIYNADGTLTGNRIVTQGANTLAFNGTAVNAFSVDGGTLSVDAANDRVGIGTTNPQAQLHLGQTLGNRKIVMFDGYTNDNEFYGFGVNPFTLRYQVPFSGAAHVFYAGNVSNSNELFRINGNGTVGIGTATPQKMFHVTGASQFSNEINVGGTASTAGSPGTAGQVLTSAGVGAAPTWTTPAVVTSTNIYNADGTLTGNRIVTQGANTLAFNGTAVNAFSVDGGTLSVDAANNRVGIGTTNPHAELQLSNATANRKLVLWDNKNDDNQYFGFGINSSLLRYQTDATSADHAFFAGTSTTASNELMRIKGNGNVGIGTATPQKQFHVTGASQFSNEINVGGTATTPGSAGTTGQVLTSAGAGAAPTWTTPAVVTSTNIYNADGTLTGNRTVTQADKTLSFTTDNTKVNAFSVDSGTLSVDALNNRVGIGNTTPNSKFFVRGSNSQPVAGTLNPDALVRIDGGTGHHLDIGTLSNNPWGSYINSLNYTGETGMNLSLNSVGGNVGIGTLVPQRTMHVNGSLQVTNELNVGGSGNAAGNAGTTGQVLMSNGAGAAPKWGTLADVTPTSTGSVLVVDGKFIIAQEISVQMTGDFTSTGSTPTAIGNLTNEIIDNENRFNGTASGNSFTVSANGTYQLTMNASLTDVTTDLNPVIGIYDDTANQWVARVNDQYKSTGSTGVPKLQTYTLIVAFPLVTTHTYSFRQATPVGTITVKSHSTAYATPDTITAPFTQMSLKRLK